MKKTILAVTLLACLFTVGCTVTQDTGEVAALQSQVEELQKELDSLQQPEASPTADADRAESPVVEGSTANTDHAEASVAENPLSRADTSEKSATAETPTVINTLEAYDIAGLETAVSGIVNKISTATVSGDAQTDHTVFRELHSELESVENQLDQMEDIIEADVRGGVLTRNDYQELDRQLDALDNQLDRAEDTLEFTFGLDD